MNYIKLTDFRQSVMLLPRFHSFKEGVVRKKEPLSVEGFASEVNEAYDPCFAIALREGKFKIFESEPELLEKAKVQNGLVSSGVVEVGYVDSQFTAKINKTIPGCPHVQRIKNAIIRAFESYLKKTDSVGFFKLNLQIPDEYNPEKINSESFAHIIMLGKTQPLA